MKAPPDPVRDESRVMTPDSRTSAQQNAGTGIHDTPSVAALQHRLAQPDVRPDIEAELVGRLQGTATIVRRAQISTYLPDAAAALIEVSGPEGALAWAQALVLELEAAQ